jgi:hypothetical protein
LISRDDVDGMVKSINDDNQALAIHTRRGIRGSIGRRGSPRRGASPEREASLEPIWKRDLSKI